MSPIATAKRDIMSCRSDLDIVAIDPRSESEERLFNGSQTCRQRVSERSREWLVGFDGAVFTLET